MKLLGSGNPTSSELYPLLLQIRNTRSQTASGEQDDLPQHLELENVRQGYIRKYVADGFSKDVSETLSYHIYGMEWNKLLRNTDLQATGTAAWGRLDTQWTQLSDSIVVSSDC